MSGASQGWFSAQASGPRLETSGIPNQEPEGILYVFARPNRWPGLFVLLLRQLVVVLDCTIVNIALPAAQADLGLSDNQRRQVVTA